MDSLKVQGGDLKWSIKDRALIEWHDGLIGKTRCLGHLSNDPALALWVGHDPTPGAKSLLIVFDVPFKQSRTRQKRCKHMCFAVRSETLMSSNYFVPEVVSTPALSAQTLNNLRRVGLVENSFNRVIRISFQLSSPAHVIMPNIQFKTPLEGSARDVVQSLRSLSETRSFHVYMKFNTYLQKDAEGVRDMLLEGFTTPDIDMRPLYEGRRPAINAWDKYPCSEVDASTPPNPLEREASLPPHYEEVDSDSIEHITDAEPMILVPFSDKDNASPRRRSSSAGVIPETPMDAAASNGEPQVGSEHPDENQNSSRHPSRKRKATTELEHSAAGGPSRPARPRAATKTLTSTDLHILLAEWIRSAANINSRVHELACMRGVLLKAGAMARKANVERFDEAMDACCARFALSQSDDTLAAISRDNGEFIGVEELEPQFRDIAKWARSFSRKVPRMILAQLVDWGEAVRRDDVEESSTRKSFCVSSVFFICGDLVNSKSS